MIVVLCAINPEICFAANVIIKKKSLSSEAGNLFRPSVVNPDMAHQAAATFLKYWAIKRSTGNSAFGAGLKFIRRVQAAFGQSFFLIWLLYFVLSFVLITWLSKQLSFPKLIKIRSDLFLKKYAYKTVCASRIKIKKICNEDGSGTRKQITGNRQSASDVSGII